MKKVILMMAVVSMITLTHAGKVFNTAVEYNNFMVGQYNLLADQYTGLIELMSADPTNKTAIWDAHGALVNQCEVSLKEVKNAESFGETGDYFKEVSLSLINVYHSFVSNGMVEVITLYLKDEFTQADSDRITALQSKFLDDEYIQGILFDAQQSIYAEENGFSIDI